MKAHYVAAVLIAALVVVTPIWIQSVNELVAVALWLYVFAAGVCAFLALLVVRRWGFRGKFGLVHLGIACGVLLAFIGYVVIAIYELELQIQLPYPSLADVFFLASYLPFAIGVSQFLRTFRHGMTTRWSFAAVGVGLFYLGLVCALIIGPILVSAEDFLTKALDLAYPILDSLLVVLVLFMFFSHRGGKMASSWVWISIGMFLIALYDLAFSQAILQGVTYSSLQTVFIEFWIYTCLGFGAYICLGLGLVEQRSLSF